MNHLTVLACPPVAGRVKPRLSPALPERLAAKLYEGILADTLAAAAACGADARVIAWSEAEGAPAAPAGFTQYAQAEGDLGARITNAFERAFAAGAKRAVVVTLDCPQLRSAALDQAFGALEREEIVVSTENAAIIGLTLPITELFRGIPWGSGAECLATMTRWFELARPLEPGPKIGWRSLDRLARLDTPADLAALIGECASGRDAACGPRTRAALREMGLLP